MLPLWVAEMDVLLAPAVAAVLHTAVSAGDTGYPSGPRAYAEALSSFARQRWGWSGIAPERTALVADVMTGIVELLKLITDAGDTVIVWLRSIRRSTPSSLTRAAVSWKPG